MTWPDLHAVNTGKTFFSRREILVISNAYGSPSDPDRPSSSAAPLLRGRLPSHFAMPRQDGTDSALPTITYRYLLVQYMGIASSTS